MKEILLETYTIALPILIGYIVWLLKKQNRDRYHEEWTARGYVTKHGIENFLEMYNAYHVLGRGWYGDVPSGRSQRVTY